MLLDNKEGGAEPTANGITPLYMTAQNGSTAIASLLLDRNMVTSKSDGWTSLHVAAACGHVNMVSF